MVFLAQRCTCHIHGKFVRTAVRMFNFDSAEWVAGFSLSACVTLISCLCKLVQGRMNCDCLYRIVFNDDIANGLQLLLCHWVPQCNRCLTCFQHRHHRTEQYSMIVHVLEAARCQVKCSILYFHDVLMVYMYRKWACSCIVRQPACLASACVEPTCLYDSRCCRTLIYCRVILTTCNEHVMTGVT